MFDILIDTLNYRFIEAIVVVLAGLCHVGTCTVDACIHAGCRDVDLADAQGNGLAEVLVGDTGSAVKDQGKTYCFLEFCQALKIQLGDSFVMAMGVADGYSQGVDVSLCREGPRLFDIRILGDFLTLSSLFAADGTELRFDGSAELARKPCYFVGLVNVLLQGIVGSVSSAALMVPMAISMLGQVKEPMALFSASAIARSSFSVTSIVVPLCLLIHVFIVCMLHSFIIVIFPFVVNTPYSQSPS